MSAASDELYSLLIPLNHERLIVPLMFSMIGALEQFISLDLPFHTRERVDRVRRLRDNMAASEITISEKYRQIMDAYLVETDFGRTVEAEAAHGTEKAT